MQILRRFWGIPVMEIWFKIPKDFSCGKHLLCQYKNLEQPLNLLRHQKVLSSRDGQTLITNLKLTQEELLARCASDVRNEIRRADRECVVVEHYSSTALRVNAKVLQDFSMEYAKLCKQKGLPNASVLQYLQELCDCGALTISIAKIEDQSVAYHVYVVGDSMTRLLFSVSSFRDCDDNATRNAIGRANRFLHYQDLIYFQGLGCEIYDWGGYSSDPKLASINNFKVGFGGTRVPRYYSIITSHFFVLVGYKIVQSLRSVGR